MATCAATPAAPLPRIGCSTSSTTAAAWRRSGARCRKRGSAAMSPGRSASGVSAMSLRSGSTVSPRRFSATRICTCVRTASSDSGSALRQSRVAASAWSPARACSAMSTARRNSTSSRVRRAASRITW
jgi:hypothetical protein